MKISTSALAVLAAGLIATSMPASAQSILVDMKGPGAGNPFWAAVERGALDKGKELGVEVVVLAPPTESDVAAQIAQIEDQLAKGIKGLVLAPTDPNALAPIVDEAVADGVPVVFIDTKGSNGRLHGSGGVNGRTMRHASAPGHLRAERAPRLLDVRAHRGFDEAADERLVRGCRQAQRDLRRIHVA